MNRNVLNILNFFFHNQKLKTKICNILEKPIVDRVIIFLIVINAIIFAIDSHDVLAKSPIYPVLISYDEWLLYIFTLEIFIRMYAMGIKNFFKNPWMVFDCIVIGVCYFPYYQHFAFLRAVKIFRIYRIIEFSKNMQIIIAALWKSIPRIFTIMSIMGLIVFVTGIIATELYGASQPDFFGNLKLSIITLFQIMIADNWGNVVRAVEADHAFSSVFFIAYTILMGFVILNVFIGIIVVGIQDTALQQKEKKKKTRKAKLEQKIDMMEDLLKDIRSEIENGKKL